jgi:hypothetical protein
VKILQIVNTVLLIAAVVLLAFLFIDVRVQWLERQAYDAAMVECLDFNGTDVLFIEGEAWCQLVYQGTSYIGKLEELKARAEAQ